MVNFRVMVSGGRRAQLLRTSRYHQVNRGSSLTCRYLCLNGRTVGRGGNSQPVGVRD